MLRTEKLCVWFAANKLPMNITETIRRGIDMFHPVLLRQAGDQEGERKVFACISPGARQSVCEISSAPRTLSCFLCRYGHGIPPRMFTIVCGYQVHMPRGQHGLSRPAYVCGNTKP